MDINIPLNDLYEKLVSIRANGGQVISQPLGFYRIFITATSPVTPGLMLHAWLGKGQFKQSNGIDIHSHTFDMHSRVLAGELINELYDIFPATEGDYKLVNVHFDNRVAKRTVLNQRVSARLIKSELVKEGLIYSFPSKVFHCTKIVRYPTLTLMEKTNMIPDDAVNIIPAEHDINELGVFKAPIFDQEEIWNAILAVLGGKINSPN